jgi:hypothetical protein
MRCTQGPEVLLSSLMWGRLAAKRSIIAFIERLLLPKTT